ncbi:restriction endonuclease subunit S [Leyella stercorea]|uniref:restriction endonuclease subunit S n=1 Tax=Leyella stercorea TaxID=363265 RepID=UPI002430FB61|nr:restriction endonuclease subunit S [Leyella stercorea]
MIQSYIDWTPLILDHWKELLFKQCVTINNGRDYKNIESTEGVPVIGSGGQFTYCTEEMYNGEVIFLGRKGTIDKPIYYKGPFWAVDTMFYAIPNKKFCAKYLYYLSTCFPFKGISTQTALPSMTQTALKNVVVFTPSLADQQRMVTYLDTKLSEIDHQVSLLTSKRDAYLRLKKSIINHAVTRGLNPNVKMKDSGIEWIGEVPEHWKVKRMKELSAIGSGTTPKSGEDKYYENGIHPWLNTSDVQDCVINEAKFSITDKALNDYSVLKYYPIGTILIAMYGGGTIGNVALMNISATINQACCAIVSNEKLLFPKYLFCYLKCHKKKIISLGFGGTQVNLSQAIIAQLPVVLPPLPEQCAIATYLDDKCAKIDTVVSNLDKQISRYADLKRSLIDEVITGKRAV